MARRDRSFNIIERVGDNAYKLQLHGDMAVSTTNSDLSPYVVDCFEDPSDLRRNHLEEGEVDIEQGIQKSSLNPNQEHDVNQAKEDQGKQIMT